MTDGPGTYYISAKFGPSGTLRISKEFASQFPGKRIVQGRARIPEGSELAIVINVPNRTLDGLKPWLRNLPENVEYHSFLLVLQRKEPLALSIETHSEPARPEQQSNAPAIRPTDGLFLGTILQDNFNELLSTGEPFALDEMDLLTHAFICGVTGSGKTVLGKAILEEAAIRGIPAIAIDLKGDISSLAIVMSGEDESEILPFVSPRRNSTVEETVAAILEEHRRNLAKWGFTHDYVEEFKRKVSVNVFTPRSDNGFRLALSAFPEPEEDWSDIHDSDPDAYESLIEFLTEQFVARLTLSKKGTEKARGYLFEILKACFRDKIEMHGYDGVKRIVDEFSSAFIGIDQIGAKSTVEYISSKDREDLSNAVNALLTGAGTRMFEGWPVTIDGLVSGYSDTGKTPVSVINLSHLEFKEQAYVVGYLAHLIGFWMRKMPPTDEPRLLFYIDEIGGGGGKTAFFPSVAMSPCKPALNSLLRQGRAFGVSCIFATQNPGDIDYKGLSNCGTWMVGCLRTKLDQNKIAQGASDAELEFESARSYLPTLASGQFIVKSPGQPWCIIQERWLLSYHRPLAAMELRKLKAAYEEGARLLLTKAVELRDQRMPSDAIRLLRQLFAEYPYASSIGRGYLLLAWALYESGKITEALHELRQALKRWIADEELSEAKFLVGLCHEQVADFADASTAFAEAQRISTDADFKEHARVHAEYCDSRNAWPTLGLGEKLIWWISGRRPDDGTLEELRVQDSEILTSSHRMYLDKIDWALPPEIDYESFVRARELLEDETEEISAESIRIRDRSEKQAAQLPAMRASGDVGGVAKLAKRIIQQLSEAGVVASDAVMREIHLSNDLVNKHRSDLRSRVSQVEARQFECDIAGLLRKMGYRSDVTRVTGDGGVDVFARRDEERIVIQCKKWNNKVIGRAIVDELGGTAQRHGATRAILATTASFSSDAIRAAKQLEIDLWDFDVLARMFRTHGQGSSESD